MYSMAKQWSTRGFTLKLAVQTLICHELSIQSCFFSVCILRPIRPVTMNKLLRTEIIREMSENHCESMFYPYICTDCSSLVNVSHENSVSLRVLNT